MTYPPEPQPGTRNSEDCSFCGPVEWTVHKVERETKETEIPGPFGNTTVKSKKEMTYWKCPKCHRLSQTERHLGWDSA